MSVKRYAAKRDMNESEIVDALEAAGATVIRLSMTGVPDILVGYSDIETGEPKNALMEIKTDKGKLTPDQLDWIANWRGQVFVVRSYQEALEAIGRA